MCIFLYKRQYCISSLLHLFFTTIYPADYSIILYRGIPYSFLWQHKYWIILHVYFIRYYRIPLYGDFVLYLYQHCLTFSVTSQPCQEKRFLPGKWELVFQCSSSLHLSYGYAAAKSRQSCLTPRDSRDCSLPGPSVHGIFQARVLE